jgi:hypothetical protein
MVSNVFLVASCWGGGTGQLCVQQLGHGRLAEVTSVQLS